MQPRLIERNTAMLNRRELLSAALTSTAALSLGQFPQGWADGPDGKKRRILMYTKSAGYEHSSVRRNGDELGPAEQVLMNLGQKHGFNVTATKDGGLITAENLAHYDAVFFFTQGDLAQVGTDKQPPVTAEGKKALLNYVKSGKGFLGTHCASDTWHSEGKPFEAQTKRDPYIDMVGGEFIRHGAQQKATMRVLDPQFPGATELGRSFDIKDEWYSLKNFAEDMHVILVQQTEGMTGPDYDRPDYPATWARQHGKGRVFYTSMGHREDVWTNPVFQNILLGAISWATGNVSADVSPNIEQATPGYAALPKPR